MSTYTPVPVTPTPSTSGGGGGGGVTSHNALTGRSNANGHPIGAITGLQAELDALDVAVGANAYPEVIFQVVGAADFLGGAFPSTPTGAIALLANVDPTWSSVPDGTLWFFRNGHTLRRANVSTKTFDLVTQPQVADYVYVQQALDPATFTTTGAGFIVVSAGPDINPTTPITLQGEGVYTAKGALANTLAGLPAFYTIPELAAAVDGFDLGGSGIVKKPVYADPATIATKVLRCVDETGGGNWATPAITTISAGIDLRALIKFQRPNSFPTQSYMEFLTQTRAGATGGDAFEAAILWPDESFASAGMVPGVPTLFWEATATGDPGETSLLTGDCPLTVDAWQWVRITQECATGMVRLWRAAPYQFTPADELDDNGVLWTPVHTSLNVKYESFLTSTEDWAIGYRGLFDIAFLRLTEFGSSTKIIDITPTVLDALTLGDTSFTDAAGVTWTTTLGSIAAGS